MSKRTLFFCLLPVLLCACGGMNGEKLRRYVEDEKNGLVVTQTFPDADYRLGYRPNDLAYLYETDRPDREELERYREEHAHNSLFILDINLNEAIKNSTVDFAEVKATYQNASNARFVSLKNGGETFPCIIYHCETTGKGRYKISLLFGRGETGFSHDTEVEFYDPVTGYTPRFLFQKDVFRSIPSLNI